MSAVAAQPMVDLAFEVSGTQIPGDYRSSLWVALCGALPWLGDEPLAGVLGIRASLTAVGVLLLSRRSRLTLRLPEARAQAAHELQGRTLAIGQDTVQVGAAHARALWAADTLYSQFVVTDGDDETAHRAEVEAALAALGAPCDLIFGRARTLPAEGRTLHGRALALHGLAPGASLRVQRCGLGPERRLGCGIFIPHKRIAGLQGAGDGDEDSAMPARINSF